VRGNDYSGKYLTGTPAGSMGENGGTGRQTLSVGSYVNRNNWIDFSGKYRAQNWLKVGEISGFSSRGPTPDGRMKPDIAAPGQMVASAVHNRQFAPWMAENTLYQSQFNGETQYWTMFSGTSMAAPHAAGIVALMLEANPQLKLNEIKQILRTTAIRDDLTGADSNNNFGYGRINALDAVKMASAMNHVHLTGVTETEFVLYPVPAGHFINIRKITGSNAKIRLELKDLQGRSVMKKTLFPAQNGFYQSSLTGLSQGVYLYEINEGNVVQKGQIMIQHP
jgi:subtilisin family serine protease